MLAVKTDPVLAERARDKFAHEIQEGRIEVRNVGTIDKEGLADFWVCEGKPEFTSLYRAIAALSSCSRKSIRVPLARLGRLSGFTEAL